MNAPVVLPEYIIPVAEGRNQPGILHVAFCQPAEGPGFPSAGSSSLPSVKIMGNSGAYLSRMLAGELSLGALDR